jgi:hypothetical protein
MNLAIVSPVQRLEIEFASFYRTCMRSQGDEAATYEKSSS